jgi:hypothetical protein
VVESVQAFLLPRGMMPTKLQLQLAGGGAERMHVPACLPLAAVFLVAGAAFTSHACHPALHREAECSWPQPACSASIPETNMGSAGPIWHAEEDVRSLFDSARRCGRRPVGPGECGAALWRL